MNFNTLTEKEVLFHYNKSITWKNEDYNNKLTALMELTSSTLDEFRKFVRAHGLYFREPRNVGNYNYNKALLNLLSLFNTITVKDAKGRDKVITSADLEEYLRERCNINIRMVADGCVIND